MKGSERFLCVLNLREVQENHFTALFCISVCCSNNLVFSDNDDDENDNNNNNSNLFIPYPTAFPYGNGMVLHFYQQQESSTTKTVHKVINKELKAYV